MYVQVLYSIAWLRGGMGAEGSLSGLGLANTMGWWLGGAGRGSKSQRTSARRALVLRPRDSPEKALGTTSHKRDGPQGRVTRTTG